MRTKKLEIKLNRIKEKIVVYIKVPAEVEDFFRNLSENKTQTSQYWKNKEGNGQEFYLLTSSYADVILDKYLYFSDYGDGLLKDNTKANIAILRTVKASEGVWLTSDRFQAISNLDFEFYIRRLGELTKELWEKYISKKQLKAIITFEI